MTRVFGRFDQIGLVCAAVASTLEAVRLRASSRRALGWTRLCLVSLTIAALAVLIMALYLSPAIAGLHGAGAIRGDGLQGLELERLHRWAERVAKVEVLALVAALFGWVLRAGQGPTHGHP
jgi:hypothetical protein